MLSRTILTQTAVLTRVTGETEKYRRPTFETTSKYGKPQQVESPQPSLPSGVTIPCRKEGYHKYYPTNNTLRDFNAWRYITIDEIKTGDRLDGQVVIGVSVVTDFRGNISHYESTVGNFAE